MLPVEKHIRCKLSKEVCHNKRFKCDFFVDAKLHKILMKNILLTKYVFNSQLDYLKTENDIQFMCYCFLCYCFF